MFQQMGRSRRWATALRNRPDAGLDAANCAELFEFATDDDVQDKFA